MTKLGSIRYSRNDDIPLMIHLTDQLGTPSTLIKRRRKLIIIVGIVLIILTGVMVVFADKSDRLLNDNATYMLQIHSVCFCLLLLLVANASQKGDHIAR